MNTNSRGSTRKKSSAVRSRPQTKDADGARLGTAGRELFKWCEDHFNIDRVRPVLQELCELQDRLEQVRMELRKSPDPKLINAETKLSAAFARAWRLAGFADSEVPKNRVGRPAGVPIQPRVKTGGFGVVS